MKTSFWASFIFLLIFFASCQKNETQPSSKTNSSTKTNANVVLIGKNDLVLNDTSGITVIAKTSSSIQKLPIDAIGNFLIPAINQGNLDLTVSKPGFSTIYQTLTATQIDSLNKGLNLIPFNEINLFPVNPVSINSLSATLNLVDSCFEMTCNISAMDSSLSNGVTYFIQRNSNNITANNFLFSNAFSVKGSQRLLTFKVKNGVNYSKIYFSFSKNCDFLHSGDMIFIKAFGNVYSQFQNYYINGITNQIVFPNINLQNSSPTISIQIP